MIKFSDVVAKHFWEVHQAIKEHKYTHYWTSGGRGSTKSSFCGIEVITLILRHKDCNAVVLRKVAATLRDSVYAQIQWGISTMGLDEQFIQKTSPLRMIYKPTGQQIVFLGVDKKEKIKSIKPRAGYFGVVWYEEVDQFSGMEELRSLNQSLLRGGEKFWCFYSYNPPKSRDSWVNQEVLIDEADRLVHHSTYLGVPREWLGDLFFLEAEKLKNKNEMAYRHEYLGEATGTGGAVFSNVENMEMGDELIGRFDRLHYGLDFGFATDPLAFICMHYDKKHEILYIFNEVYKFSLDTRPAAEMVKKLAQRRLVIADSAEPRTIRSFEKYGCNIKGAKKGPDSVEHGIKWLQDLRAIYIDKRRCPNAYREFVGYEYAQNKDGQFISQYPDKNNHAIDAVRYGMEAEMLDDVFSFD